MSKYTYFKISKGVVNSDCLPETKEFLKLNSQFFFKILQPVKRALEEDGPVTFISFEQDWSFACEVHKVELGQISGGHGALADTAECAYDDLIELLYNKL